MNTMIYKPNDIVYVLKNDVEPDELRYSLRSVVQNFAYNKIWFYGGLPKGIEPDHYVNFRQEGGTKYEKTRSTLRSIFENDDITEDFYLFNDDFFIMHWYAQNIPITNGTIMRQVRRIEDVHDGLTGYTKRLRRASAFLEELKMDTISYECHVPMLINRKKALKILEFEDPNAIFRSTYGNYYEIGGIIQTDSKIASLTKMPTGKEIILSTSDESFRKGLVGSYIRERFPWPCKYEVDRKELDVTEYCDNDITATEEAFKKYFAES